MMAILGTNPGTSTPKQRQTLVLTARKRGITLDQLRERVGGSLRQLSAQEASNWIKRLGGGELTYEPGHKPAPYAGRRQRTDAIRMICDDHIEQIERLLGECFKNKNRATAWLKKNFKIEHPRDLLTARRASKVIWVLKEMLAREAESVESATADQ